MHPNDGWSLRQAQRPGKAEDLIAAQGADWDDQIAQAKDTEPLPRVFLPWERARRRPPPMAMAQARHQLQRRFQGQVQAFLPGTAGEIEKALYRALELVQGRSVSPIEFVRQVMTMANAARGVLLSSEIGERGEILRVKYRFADGSQLVADGEGVR